MVFLQFLLCGEEIGKNPFPANPPFPNFIREVFTLSKKFVYAFSEGNAKMRELLGGKGANLAEMTVLGMPVPQGFTVTTEACTQYYADNREINDEIKADIFKYMGILEEQTGKTFGGGRAGPGHHVRGAAGLRARAG